MLLPKITSTTQIVRNISVLTDTPDDQLQIITKGSKEIGVYAPIKLFQELTKNLTTLPTDTRADTQLSKTLQQKISKLNGLKFQRSVRSEY